MHAPTADRRTRKAARRIGAQARGDPPHPVSGTGPPAGSDRPRLTHQFLAQRPQAGTSLGITGHGVDLGRAHRAPGLEQVAANLAGKLKVVKVNVDEAPRTAARFDARSIPTLVLLQGGKKVATRVGAAPADQLEAWVRAESPR